MKRVTITIRNGGNSRLIYTDHGWMVYKNGRTVSADANGHDAALDAEAAGIVPPGASFNLNMIMYHTEQLCHGGKQHE